MANGTDEIWYKGFYTTIHFERETNTYYGKIEEIKDLVTWETESDDFLDLYIAFSDAVDDYLEFCDEVGCKNNAYTC